MKKSYLLFVIPITMLLGVCLLFQKNVSAQVQISPGTLDFGGMYSQAWGYKNPATNGFSCPSGYASSLVVGYSGVDYDVSLCSRPHTTLTTTYYDFGGMYGTKPCQQIAGNCYTEGASGIRWTDFKNPITSLKSCPLGYISQQIIGGGLGTGNPDYPLFYCYRPHNSSNQLHYVFGGMFNDGYTFADVDPSLATYLRKNDNPATRLDN